MTALLMATAQLRARVRAAEQRHGKSFFAPPPINKRLHLRMFGCMEPRRAGWRSKLKTVRAESPEVELPEYRCWSLEGVTWQ